MLVGKVNFEIQILSSILNNPIHLFYERLE